MRIRSVEAENFMKFSQLKLSDLPAEGVIGVEGPNESGKSTIGEAILFAFFGRSRLSKGCPIENMIRWGADFLRVRVEFDLPGTDGEGEESFAVFREVDRFGTNYVKLLALSDGGETREVAAGNIDVAAFLAERVEHDFFEFQHAFYHDQYGSRYVDDTLREFVERLTGVRQMQAAVESIRTRIEQREREFSHYQRDIKRNLTQAERSSGSVGRLPELREAATTLSASVEEKKREIADLKKIQGERRDLASACEPTEKKIRDAIGKRGQELSGAVGSALGELEPLASGNAAAVDKNLAREFSRSRDTLREVDAMLRDFDGLRQGYEQARSSLESQLGPESATGGGSSGSGSSLRDQRVAREAEHQALLGESTRGGLGMLIFLVLFVFFGACAAFPYAAPDDFARITLPEGVEKLHVAVASGVLSAIFLILTIAKAMRRADRRARAEAAGTQARDAAALVDAHQERLLQLQALDAVEESGTVADYVGAAKLVDAPDVSARLEKFQSDHRALLGGENDNRDYRGLLRSVADREKSCRKKLQSAAQADGKKIKELEATLKKTTSDRDRAENDIRECEAQAAKREALEEKNRELDAAAAEIRGDIDDAHAACELLEACVKTTRAKVGPALGGYLHGILPRLTTDRYRDVKLDADLRMEVFASARRDFIPATELSGGTNEALLLGLRLALSQAFISARTRQSQFIFLDEPFKMMDPPRVLRAIEALPELSDDIRQFFVVQPNFTGEQREALDFLVTTTVETTDLEVDLAAR